MLAAERTLICSGGTEVRIPSLPPSLEIPSLSICGIGDHLALKCGSSAVVGIAVVGIAAASPITDCLGSVR